MKTIGELNPGDIIYHYYGNSFHPFIISSIIISTISKSIIINGRYVDSSFYDNSGFNISYSFINKSSSITITTHNDEEGVKEMTTNRMARLMYLENMLKRKF